MKPQKLIVKALFSFLAAFAILLPTASGWTTPERFQTGGDLVLDSEKVCSPRTSNKCLPGPFDETVQVPEGVTGVNIDVYWIWTGDPAQNQPNEHSYFTATAGDNELGQVYCQDFGNEAQTHSKCGSVSGSVSAGQTLTLEIVHADTNRGPTPGSHRQQWVIDWVESTPPTAVPPTNTPVVQPPVFTSTPTSQPPTEVPPTGTPTNTPTSQPPTEVPPTNTPTDTPVVQPPVFTNTPTSQPPTEVPPTNTPTSTSVVQPPAPSKTPTTPPPTQAPPTRTPTEVPTEEEESPRATRTPTPLVSGPSVTRTPGPAARVSATPPASTPTRTPPAVLPVTGGDYAGPGLVDFAWKAGLVVFGLLLAAFGLLHELRDIRR